MSNLWHPVPQRANPFIFSFDDDEISSRKTPSSSFQSLDALARPVSAPILESSTSGPLHRPSSPFSRVTNPMVRDKHFRKGFINAREEQCITKDRFKSSTTNLDKTAEDN